MVGLPRKRVFPKTKGDSITGQDRAQKHCDFRFSQIEKKSEVAVLQLHLALFRQLGFFPNVIKPCGEPTVENRQQFRQIFLEYRPTNQVKKIYDAPFSSLKKIRF